MMWFLLVVLVIAFLISFLITKFLVHYLTKKGLMDVPNERSSHKIPTPRGGGLAIIISIFVSVFFLKMFYPELPIPGILFFIGLFIISLTSFIDDKLDLPASLRFLLHAVAAGAVIYETGGFEKFPLPDPLGFNLYLFAIPLTFIWIVAVVNIYNFLDGIDGFAGTQALIGGLGIALLDLNGVGFYLGLIIAAASLGFLFLNWHPAKIFMGDIGSASLGFVFATLPLYFSQTDQNIGVFSVVIFLWFFLSDGAYTLIRRALNGEKIWEAHKSHLYQTMVIYGKSHSEVVIKVMFPALLLTITFLFLYYFFYDYLLISLVIAIIMFFFYLISVKKRKRTSEPVS